MVFRRLPGKLLVHQKLPEKGLPRGDPSPTLGIQLATLGAEYMSETFRIIDAAHNAPANARRRSDACYINGHEVECDGLSFDSIGDRNVD